MHIIEVLYFQRLVSPLVKIEGFSFEFGVSSVNHSDSEFPGGNERVCMHVFFFFFFFFFFFERRGRNFKKKL